MESTEFLFKSNMTLTAIDKKYRYTFTETPNWPPLFWQIARQVQ
jgi:hypothetical protein